MCICVELYFSCEVVHESYKVDMTPVISKEVSKTRKAAKAAQAHLVIQKSNTESRGQEKVKRVALWMWDSTGEGAGIQGWWIFKMNL